MHFFECMYHTQWTGNCVGGNAGTVLYKWTNNIRPLVQSQHHIMLPFNTTLGYTIQ